MNKKIPKANNKDLAEKLRFFENACRKKGLKVTPQRIEIYKELLVSFLDHPSAVRLYQKLKKSNPYISLDTVNRNLATFCKIGVIETVEGSGNPKRFDIDLRLHHHFRCLKCNRLIDIYNKDFDKVKIPKELDDHFTIYRKKVYLEGVCHRCKK